MSSTNGIWVLLLFAASLNAAPHPVSCPASIKVIETAAPVEGWKTPASTAEHTFERVSILNGKEGGEEYDLAPDDQQQKGKTMTSTWRLKGYRTMNIFMRCQYRDTKAVLTMDLPAPLETCSFTFETTAQGKIVGKPSAMCK